MPEVPQNIKKEHLLRAIEEIQQHGIPAGAHSSTYDVVYKGERYPPKLVVSIANRFANDKELDRQAFRGGLATDAFQLLEREGFTIQAKRGRFESGYEALKKRFLGSIPDFSGFQKSKRYLESERAYKDELVRVFNEESREYLERKDWSGFGGQVSGILTRPLQANDGRPQNLVGWRYYDPIRKLEASRLADLGHAVGDLVNEERNLEDRLHSFVDHLQQISGNPSYPSAAASRSLISFYLTLAHPQQYFFLKTTEIRKAIRFFEPDFRWNPQGLTADELRNIQSLAGRIYDRLQEEGWNPVDLIDVQGFLWIATYWDQEAAPVADTESDSAKEVQKPMNIGEPLNQILYGPPGTGKTFATVNKALKILDPELLTTAGSDREILRRRFDELRDLGRIGTVTFHQSFSYEDFVEGIRASTDDNGAIRYEIEPGIFKRMCDAARSKRVSTISAFSAGQTFGRDYKVREATPDVLRLTKPNGSKLSFDMELLHELATLVEAAEITIQDIAEEKVFDKADVRLEKYLLHGYSNILPKLVDHLVSAQKRTGENTGPQNDAWVLIIDEINRGNIANIFGELITLIEPTKREGASEETEITLPYSKERFCVPQNLHIVGTMNTADRSLVQMDTALRRRFVFEAMMPSMQVLSSQGIEEIEGVDIVTMLEVMNQRIELLFDREHTLGHTFFLPLADTPTLSRLADIFERQILPLLEEYFFEDWSKIRQVLGDDQKTDQSTCFVVPLHTESSIQALLAAEVPQELVNRAYARNEVAFLNPDSYRLIYQRDEA